MGNPNAPFGLRPVKHLKGGVVRYNDSYAIADQYGTSLFLGDPVLVTGNGANIGIASAGNGDVVSGVFAGCKFVNSFGDTIWSRYWPSGTATKNAAGAVAYVFDDPDLLFEIMFATMAITDMRSFSNLVAGAGNTATGLSGWTAAQAGGSQNQLKLYNLPGSAVLPGGIQNAYGQYAVGSVLLNTHELANLMTVTE